MKSLNMSKYKSQLFENKDNCDNLKGLKKGMEDTTQQ
jgi:hypothetical protein